ncbi:MAG: YIP1 family protein [Paracoccus sp. (in: a-proteobacteria)]|nr:YIP1 family protein [Paracoccus sp. (in: a-proteobacteria)]
MTFNDFMTLAQVTFRDPPRALRMLQSLDLSIETRWLGLFLAVTLSAALAVIASAFFPLTNETGVIGLTRRPLALAGVQLFGMALGAWLLANVGRIFGGHGSFADALLVVTWVELLLVAVQAVQVVLMLIFPFFASFLGLAAIAAFIYLVVQFTKALHGFSSTFGVVLGLIGTAIGAGFVLSILMTMLGVAPPVGVAP